MKPVVWIGGTKRTVQEFPLEVRQVIGYALYQAQEGGKHILSKPLKGFGGASILEVVADDDGNTYRAVYTVKFADVVYVLHAFQKKSKKGIKTRKQDIDLIKQRLRTAELDYAERRRRK